ncbi:hypothetical protein [Sandaracinus amylolyticus]|uniref:hypothetical protein n=1 Tax=Sandaracinus amylolyticus TaxID=927083 RepID=UPI001F299E06|nr:hypothetical protein [Sandaracinus amylolyticus]UJR80051.1 Hypothetical protein I5071_20950 [Sandaracinus amylolyticus]
MTTNTVRDVWRAADETLLSRIDDERVLASLWERAAPGAEALHPRAAGMVRLLRERPDASQAIAAAEAGNVAPLLGRLEPSRLEGWAPALVHHLALFHRARAEHAIARDAVSTSAARETLERALMLIGATWLALGRERAYLRGLATDVIAGALPSSEVERAVDAAALRGLDVIAAMAREGIETRSGGAAIALRVLGRVADVITIAGAEGALADRARDRALGLRSDLVHTMLTPLTIEIEELAAREWKPIEVASVLERARDVWRWAGEEVEVERFVVRELPRFAWDLYRARRWDDLRLLLRPMEQPSDSLAMRIQRDPLELAWAAQCAQVLVFRAELAPTLDAQIGLAERGYKLCPTLRNARLVLADLLCARAERRLEGPAVLRAADAWQDAKRDITRAEEIHPELTRLPAAREKLARSR